MKTHTVYIDESGNSGLAVTDVHQPIYSCAGIWLSDQQHGKLGSLVEEIAQRPSYQMQELKGSRMLRSQRGRDLLLEIAEWCVSRDVAVSLLVCQKSFLMACVFVENCIDSVYNPSVPTAMEANFEFKNDLIRRTMNAVPLGELINFWQANHGNSKQAFVDAHERIYSLLDLVPVAQDFVPLLRCTLLNAIWAASENSKQHMKSDYSPNYVAFTTFVMNVNHRAAELDIPPVRLVHDVQDQYEDVYRDAISFMKTGPFDPTLLALEGRLVGIDFVDTIEFADSKAEAPLQVADCFAAIARGVVSEVGSGQTLLREMFRDVLRRLRIAQNSEWFPWVVGPHHWNLEVFPALAGHESPLDGIGPEIGDRF